MGEKRLTLLVCALILGFAAASVFGGDSKAGKSVYDANKCSTCHGKDGKGTKAGNPLTKFNATKYKKAILKGIKPKMPAYEKKLKSADVDHLLEYLKGLSGK